ncbi:MAG: hypothetical protein IJL92_11025 [Thermoguttaceae bacterium]|nr:hypothetical protein [Thermoguttaceae bacterium]
MGSNQGDAAGYELRRSDQTETVGWFSALPDDELWVEFSSHVRRSDSELRILPLKDARI